MKRGAEGERASERGRRRRGASRREKAEGSRSFAGDGKRNRGEPRRIERVEIGKRRGRERANGGRGDGGGGGGNVGGGGGTKGGKGEILLTYTPTRRSARATRRANARPGTREKERQRGG